MIVIPVLEKEFTISEGKNIIEIPSFDQPTVLVYTNRLGTMGNNIYIINKSAN